MNRRGSRLTEDMRTWQLELHSEAMNKDYLHQEGVIIEDAELDIEGILDLYWAPDGARVSSHPGMNVGVLTGYPPPVLYDLQKELRSRLHGSPLPCCLDTAYVRKPIIGKRRKVVSHFLLRSQLEGHSRPVSLDEALLSAILGGRRHSSCPSSPITRRENKAAFETRDRQGNESGANGIERNARCRQSFLTLGMSSLDSQFKPSERTGAARSNAESCDEQYCASSRSLSKCSSFTADAGFDLGALTQTEISDPSSRGLSSSSPCPVTPPSSRVLPYLDRSVADPLTPTDEAHSPTTYHPAGSPLASSSPLPRAHSISPLSSYSHHVQQSRVGYKETPREPRTPPRKSRRSSTSQRHKWRRSDVSSMSSVSSCSQGSVPGRASDSVFSTYHCSTAIQIPLYTSPRVMVSPPVPTSGHTLSPRKSTATMGRRRRQSSADSALPWRNHQMTPAHPRSRRTTAIEPRLKSDDGLGAKKASTAPQKAALRASLGRQQRFGSMWQSLKRGARRWSSVTAARIQTAVKSDKVLESVRPSVD